MNKYERMTSNTNITTIVQEGFNETQALIRLRELEIIGNIHDNPELLEGARKWVKQF